MKKFMFAFSLLALAQLASATTLAELAGSYKISSNDIPVLNIVTIDAEGNVKLTESSPYGKLECKGKAKLNADVLESSVKCANGQEFIQRINLKGVKSLDKFKADVYSSLYNAELKMDIEKL